MASWGIKDKAELLNWVGQKSKHASHTQCCVNSKCKLLIKEAEILFKKSEMHCQQINSSFFIKGYKSFWEFSLYR